MFCEKPLAVDVEDARAFVAEAGERINADIATRHALAVKFAAFEAEHITGVKPVNKDPETYVEEHG